MWETCWFCPATTLAAGRDGTAAAETGREAGREEEEVFAVARAGASWLAFRFFSSSASFQAGTLGDALTHK